MSVIDLAFLVVISLALLNLLVLTCAMFYDMLRDVLPPREPRWHTNPNLWGYAIGGAFSRYLRRDEENTGA